MGYQPNDFVNPNQRGVGLPAGCKNLMDVIKMDGSLPPAAGRQRIWYDDLSKVEQRVAVFLQSRVTGLLSVGILQRHILVILNRADDLTLSFSAPAERQPVVRRIFKEPKISRPIDGMEYVSVVLGPAKDAVAMTVVELLVHVFGVLEGEQLMFHSYEEVQAGR